MVREDRLSYKQQYSFEAAHHSKEAVNGQNSNGHCACAGLIFMCDEATKMDCFKYRVFGLSKKKKDLMDMITKGMHLFLFDVKLKVLHGIYVASSDGAFNLEPDAFGGNFSWQVKFQIEKACIPLPEEVFKTAIKDNYFTCSKFTRELTPEQVQKLIELFSPLPQDRSINGPQSHRDIPMASFTDTCTQTQDKNPKGILPLKASYSEATNGILKSDAPVQILYKPTSPLLDGVEFDKCIYDCCTPQNVRWGFLQCTPACATHHILDAGMDKYHQSSYELVDPMKGVVTNTCIYGFGAQNEHIHIDTHKSGMCGIVAPGIDDTCATDKACAVVERLPAYSRGLMCGDSASPSNICGCMQNYLLPTPIQETVWDGKFYDEPFVDACLHACFAPKVPLKAGVLYASPEHTRTAIGRKRPFQDVSVCAHTEAQAAFDTRGERPIRCMHQQAVE